MAYDPQTFRSLYKRLLGLYPRAFREQLGESMAQTFTDLFNERQRQTERGVLWFVLWTFFGTGLGIVREHMLLIRRGNTRQNIMANPRAAAILSFILCLPVAILFPIAILKLEPFYALVTPLFIDAEGNRQSMVGLLVVLGALLLLPVALTMNVRLIVRNVRAGCSVLAHPANLVLALAIFSVITYFVGFFIVDQYPCWIGVPNCD